MFWRTNDIKRILINNDDNAESLGVCFVTWSVILPRLMPLQQKWTSERLSVSLISTVGFEDLSNNWGEVYTLCTVLGLQATGSFRGRSWGTWWWTWARCWPRRSAPAWSRFPSNSCNPATNRSQFINMSSRRDICSKFYTTGFSGLKFDTIK